ncbi:L-cystine transport system permease protein [Cohnella thailandensis]|uniref:Amino acid ABC transporter permease n=2 Tax=Cohnella thailandensis TaxID=557557 RepID=A0A841SV74_9BACL|nr:amino acid ABC transporter permease [Cohnella thailandensis]MBP1974534.1 L-cystine transport system permease protein [Cohnella thailandensis]
MSLLISVFAILAGLVIGFLVTLCRMYKVPVLNRLAIIYVSFIRGTPLLVQIYVIYYALPMVADWAGMKLGLPISSADLPPLAFALTAFTIYSGAYLSETIRAALSAVDPGQMEAGYSVGLTTWQTFRRIVIPQAFVVALPSIGNNFLGLIKGTSLAFTVMVIEVMSNAKIAAADGYRYMESYVDAAIVYWLLCIVFERLFAWLEKRSGRYRSKSA